MAAHSNPQTSEWYSYFENDVLGIYERMYKKGFRST